MIFFWVFRQRRKTYKQLCWKVDSFCEQNCHWLYWSQFTNVKYFEVYYCETFNSNISRCATIFVNAMHIIQKINYGNIIDPLSLKWLSEQTTTCYGQFASNRSVYTSNYIGSRGLGLRDQHIKLIHSVSNLDFHEYYINDFIFFHNSSLGLQRNLLNYIESLHLQNNFLSKIST